MPTRSKYPVRCEYDAFLSPVRALLAPSRSLRTGTFEGKSMASLRTATRVQARARALVALQRPTTGLEEGALADWRASGDVAWVAHLSAGRPSVLRGALEDLLREFAQTGEAEAGVAAVLATQAYVLAVVDQAASGGRDAAESTGRTVPLLRAVSESGSSNTGNPA